MLVGSARPPPDLLADSGSASLWSGARRPGAPGRMRQRRSSPPPGHLATAHQALTPLSSADRWSASPSPTRMRITPTLSRPPLCRMQRGNLLPDPAGDRAGAAVAGVVATDPDPPASWRQPDAHTPTTTANRLTHLAAPATPVTPPPTMLHGPHLHTRRGLAVPLTRMASSRCLADAAGAAGLRPRSHDRCLPPSSACASIA